MQRFKLTIEYDGRPFVGWQRQDNGPSVQQALEDAAFAVTQAETLVYGCGRTDAGVHAEGQVAHVDITKSLAPFRLQEALNDLGADPRLVVDGRYGPAPRRAVKECQAAVGIVADGIAGPVTEARIKLSHNTIRGQ